MGFIKVGAVLFASLLVGMANASNGNKNNNNKTENKIDRIYVKNKSHLRRMAFLSSKNLNLIGI